MRSKSPLAPAVVLLGLLVLAGVTPTWADSFRLVDEDGVSYGPFDLGRTSQFSAHGHVYNITGLPEAEKQIQKALQDTTLPPFLFEDASLPTMLRFVQENVRKTTPDLSDVVFLVVAPPSEWGSDPTEAPAHGAVGVAPVAATADPPATAVAYETAARVSLQAEATSAWAFLEVVASLSRHRVRIEGRSVRLVHPLTPESPLLSRAYEVLPTLIERFGSLRPTDHAHARQVDTVAVAKSRLADSTDCKRFFEEFGVSWPTGSSANYIPTIGRLVIVNTLENHRTLASVLLTLDVLPRQVEVECQFVAIPNAAVAKLAQGGRIPSEAILDAVRNGTARRLASPKITTRNGSEATLKAVVEMRYPTEFSVTTEAATTPGGATATAIEPGAYSTREVGFILQVVPEVSPIGDLVTLTFAPQHVQRPEWRSYPVESGRKGDGVDAAARIEQPFFPVDSIATTVQLQTGATLVVGGGAPSPDGSELVYMLATATLIDPSGKETPRTADAGTLFPVVREDD